MKKSTLITTIAMIVVVVVALSTATYAWFSSQNTATANVTMKTTASAEWLIYNGSNNAGTYTFPTATNSLTLTGSGMTNGIYAPTSDALNVITVTGTTASTTSGYFFVANEENKVTTAATAMTPDVFKVSAAFPNAGTSENPTKKTLGLSIIVNAGSVETSTQLYAASQFRFNISYKTTLDGATVGTLNNAYYKANEAHGDLDELNDAASKNTTAVSQAAGITGSNISYSAAATQGTVQDQLVYTSWTHASADIANKGIKAGDYYNEYTATFANISYADSVYFSLYSWIEGWEADLNAGNATFTVTYAFYTVS